MGLQFGRPVVRACGALTLIATLSACGDGLAAPTGPITVTNVVITGMPAGALAVGQVVHLRARAHFSNFNTGDVTTSAQWTTSNPQVLDVSRTGVASATAPGEATITATYSGVTGTRVLRIEVAPATADDAFRVAILLGSSTPPAEHDVVRVFSKANELLRIRTGASMTSTGIFPAGDGDAFDLAREYMTALPSGHPDGVLVLAEDPRAQSFGGYAVAFLMPPPFANRYPNPQGDTRAYLAAIHFDHKYARCGYDDTGHVRISDRSANGECRGRNGFICVDNGQYWQCPDTLQELYAQPDYFTACSIVHEFMHPFGPAGNGDHYGTSICRNRTGMSPDASADRRLSQEHCGMCPDVFLQFRPR